MPIPGPGGSSVVEGPGVAGAALHDGPVILGDITLGVTDDYGVEWILESLTGWSDPPETTGDVDQRASDHGGWYSPAYYAPRTVEIGGSLIATDWDAATRAINRLMASVPLQTPAWLYVFDGSVPATGAMVRQDGDPLTERVGGWVRFSLSLVAADPRRYDTELTVTSTGLPKTSGGLTLGGTGLTLGGTGLTVGATVTAGVLSTYNYGNMSTKPTFTVQGPCPPFSLTHRGTGKTLRFADPVAAGRTLVIDTDRRRAALDGTAARTVTGTWFDYAPGANDVAFTASSYDAGALLISSHRSAWR